MFDSVVSTKLAPVRQIGELIGRASLRALLRQRRTGKLTLIVGPAGFGKTTLAALWRRDLIALGVDAPWLQLNEEDDDFDQFVFCFAASLHHCGCPGLAELIRLFPKAKRDNISNLAAALARAIESHKRDIHLFIDDFHHVRNRQVHRLVQRMLEIGPDNFHLTLVSRVAPPLILSRLRLQDQVTEVEIGNLRFSFEDAGDFLRQRVHPAIDEDEIRMAHELTDGWVAGLQLLAISLKKTDDRKEQLRKIFKHSTHFLDYLGEEILAGLEPEKRDFLVAISICRRFDAALCQAITGLAEVETILAQIEAENLFVLRIDHEPGIWWRFHPIFRRFLNARLAALPEDVVAERHRRASLYLSRQGLQMDAVRHSLLAGDSDRAVALVEECVWPLLLEDNLMLILSWSRQLPSEKVVGSPRLLAGMAWSLLLCRQLAEAEELFNRLRGMPQADDPWVKANILAMQASMAVYRDDSRLLAETVAQFDDPDRFTDPVLQATLCNLQGYDHVYGDRFVQAREARRRSVHYRGEKDWLVTVYGDVMEALSYLEQGDMRQAELLLRPLLDYAEAQRGRRSSAACLIAGLLAESLYEQNRLEELSRVLANRLDLIDVITFPNAMLRARLAHARRLALVEGRKAGLKAIDRLEEFASKIDLTRALGWALGERIRLLLADWRIGTAQSMLQQLRSLAAAYGARGDQVELDLVLVGAIAQARILIGDGSYLEAVECLAPIRAVWEKRGRMQVVCCLAALSALALFKLSERKAAFAMMEQALSVGRQFGLTRTFLDEGPAFLDVLTEFRAAIPAGEPIADYADHLLAAAKQTPIAAPAAAMAPPPPRLPSPPQMDGSPGLSGRELDILRLMSQALTNKRIAIALAISEETVKWHLKNIFIKLEVDTRGDALAKVRKAGLVL